MGATERWLSVGCQVRGQGASKNHEAASVSWTGRANPPNSPWKVLSRGGGDHAKRVTVARSARPILRKLIGASRRRAHPADAFSPEAPCPRATTDAPCNCQTLMVPRQSRGFTIMKLALMRNAKEELSLTLALSRSLSEPRLLQAQVNRIGVRQCFALR